ncbi:hypothetical protein K0M31_005618 [Melipona bicolor]|uniref:Uncharacterized protein n=1 Tax=Melipona bicolor TaxID=60889 RepID=A0AA40FUA6_9HYME|nr:hypothetical protein K0M31_005618 [Melipona bicolor]
MDSTTYQPPSELQLTNVYIADPPVLVLFSALMTTGGTRFASWSGSGVGGERTPASDGNRCEIRLNLHLRLTHHTVQVYPRRDFRDYLFTLRAPTDHAAHREVQRGSATPPAPGFQPPTLVHGRAHMHNLCEEFRSRSCTLSRGRDIRIPAGGNTNETGDTRWYATSSGFRRVSHTRRAVTRRSKPETFLETVESTRAGFHALENFF